MESEKMADIIEEMRMARTKFPFAYEIGRKDAPAEFDADGLMIKPRTIVIEKVTIEALADRIEKAWEREKPQPEPDWKAICEKCKEGEIEPDCEYYGEPNGCNSPIYGEHPKAKPVGNAAAMREALRTLRQRFDKNVMAYQDRYFKFSGWHWHKKAAEAARRRDVFHELREACDAALSAPPRNCDRFRTADEAENAFNEFCAAERTGKCKPAECSLPSGTGAKSCQLAWLFATAKEGGAE